MRLPLSYDKQHLEYILSRSAHITSCCLVSVWELLTLATSLEHSSLLESMCAATKMDSGFLSTRSKGHRMLKSYGNKAPDTERISYLEGDFATRWGCPNDLGMKCPITLLTATTASKIRNSRQLSQAHGCCPAHLGKKYPHLFY